MGDRSSEQIAKALKGAGLSSKDRIKVANEAWDNDDLFFPNKDDFLLEWLCTALTRSNMKALDDCALLQVDYWHLLGQLLTHFDRRHGQTPPTIRVPLMTAISTLFEHMHTTLKNDAEYRTRITLELHTCIRLLFSESFKLSYRPSWEQLTTAFDHLLDTVAIQMKLTDDAETKAMDALTSVALVLCERYDKQLVQAANQKKVGPYTALQGALANTQEQGREMSLLLTDILVHALFHADNIMEYTSALHGAGTGNKTTNYVSSLFHVLSDMSKQSQDQHSCQDALDILPLLIQYFVAAYRRKRGAQTAVAQKASRTVEFGFFAELLTIISGAKAHAPTLYLETLARLLQQVLELKIYTLQNDDVSKSQHALLDDITDRVTACASDLKVYNQASVFNVIHLLLQLDFSLVEGRIALLWPYLLNPTEEAERACLAFALAVLQTYSASRQLDTFVNDLLTALQDMAFEQVHALLKKPLFSRSFLDAFSDCVSKQMPDAQASEIFERFASELVTVSDKASNEPAAKKQKRHYNQATPAKQPLARYVAVYFVQFIDAAQVVLCRKQSAKSAVADLFANYIKPNLALYVDGQEAIACAVLPALQIHLVLTNALHETYTKCHDQATRQWLVDTLTAMFAGKKMDTLAARMTTVLTANALLQDAYFSVLGNTADVPQEVAARVNLVIDYVIEGLDTKASWSGVLLELENEEAVKIACWKLMTDEWFDIVSRVLEGGRAKKAVSLTLQPLCETSKPTNTSTLTIQLLDELLLCSATFHEAEKLRDYSIPTLHSALISTFKSLSTIEKNDKLAQHISNIQLDQVHRQPFAKELRDLIETPEKEQTTHQSDQRYTTHLQKICRLVELYLVFPLDYYTKVERSQTATLVLLTDTWISRQSFSPSPDSSKALLSCRTLLLHLSKNDTVIPYLESDAHLLNWFISSADNHATQQAIMEVTRKIDHHILLKMITAIVTNAPTAAVSKTYLETTLDTRLTWLASDKIEWVTNAMQTINDYGERHPSSKADGNGIIFASKHMNQISAYLFQWLQDARKRVLVTLNEPLTAEMELEYIAQLNLIYLVQRCATFPSLLDNKALDIDSMSRHVVALASPFLTMLQHCLKRTRSDHTHLALATAFARALCVTLSRYQTPKVTERVLAFLWYVYSLISRAGEEHFVKELSVAFSAWVHSLNKEQFYLVVDGFMDMAKRLINCNDNESDLVFISLFTLLLESCSHEQKRWIHGRVPHFMLKIAKTMGQSKSLPFVQKTLATLVQITSEQTHDLPSFDLSVLLSCILQVGTPSALERFGQQLDHATVQRIFLDICTALQNLIMHHRQHLFDVMPTVFSILVALLHCFRSGHIGLAVNKKSMTSNTYKTDKAFSLLFAYSPLDVAAADAYARLLTVMARKPLPAPGRRMDPQTSYRAMARYAPFLLVEYFTLQSKPSMSILDPNIKAVLQPGLFEIMDMCTDANREFIMTGLDGPGKLLFKQFYSHWTANHKYKGQ